MASKVLSSRDCYLAADRMAGVICREFTFAEDGDQLVIHGVPRGGVPVAYLVQGIVKNVKRSIEVSVTDRPGDAHVIVDDLIDSGKTMADYRARYPSKPFHALYTKEKDDDWIVFPWEGNESASADDIPLRLLQFIGEDPKRGGLQETPDRFLKAWQFWTKGYDEEPTEILKTFEDGAQDYDQMVLVRDIPVYSHCEHHLAPIFGVAHLAYVPNGRICGLSKLNRLVDVFARRLQVQERLTAQIADALEGGLEPLGVGVQLKCRHLCMESRGVCQQGHVTITSALRGAMKDEADARAEFMKLCE